jgi:diguanylate cyclase
VAEALRKSIASSDLIRKDTGLTIGSITISIGVASFKRDMDSIATLIARADEALYASKKSGRNRVTSEHA